MKSALLERDNGELDAAEALLRGGLAKFPDFDKMWIMLLQTHEAKKDVEGARAVVAEGTGKCPGSTPLWVAAAQFELRQLQTVKAPSLLCR